ncbi:hypothetical protein [Photorhabdus australis]|uniref:hypothetical protein n=1 Tax=Photorhabdus australis TaxID=286156 RepID=UPI0030DD2FA4
MMLVHPLVNSHPNVTQNRINLLLFIGFIDLVWSNSQNSPRYPIYPSYSVTCRVTNIYQENLARGFYTRYLSSCLFVSCTHLGHIVRYAPGGALPCRRDAS